MEFAPFLPSRAQFTPPFPTDLYRSLSQILDFFAPPLPPIPHHKIPRFPTLCHHSRFQFAPPLLLPPAISYLPSAVTNPYSQPTAASPPASVGYPAPCASAFLSFGRSTCGC